jgi:tetratricopeptide (TPR) repeat protein
MANKIKIIGLFLFLITGQIIFAQTNKEKALAKGEEAVKLMDNGKIEESIKLLEEAQKLDPESLVYPYETAYALYLKKDYNGALKILEKNKNHKDVSERFFQLFGNSYDMSGNSEKALETYEAGLKIFPNSGSLNLEKGNVYWGKEEYEKALPFYEKGIKVDPDFPSNYYRAAILYCCSNEEVWGMIYGEIFMNLEPGSKRTMEISKLLYDTYKREIKFTSDTTFSVSFSKEIDIKVEDASEPGKMKMPFGNFVYEPTLSLALINEKSININSLDRIRTKFVELYFKNGSDKKYPNILFDYQKKLLDEGYLECYNHWLLMKGVEDAFGDWYDLNKDKWDEFMKWFPKNKFKVDKSNRFYSGQYK